MYPPGPRGSVQPLHVTSFCFQILQSNTSPTGPGTACFGSVSDPQCCKASNAHPWQEELLNIFAMARASSLDVERKHAHDKKNERSRLITIARASRNSIIRQYRQTRTEHLQAMRSIDKNLQKAYSVSAPSLALRENPSLAVRIPEARKIKVDGTAMTLYLKEHGARLKEEAAAKRATAEAPRLDNPSPVWHHTSSRSTFLNLCS